MSTPERPKQLLPLVNEEPLLVNAVRRLAPIIPAANTLVLTNASLAPAISEALPQLPSANIIPEPRPSGTAAALTWAALEIESRAGSDAVMICVHADWAIADESAFRAALLAAEEVARTEGALVTVGVVPTRADPGLGYIQPGAPVDGGAFEVRRFVEKPGREQAQRMVHEGCLWNSGIFVWKVGLFLAEIRMHTPEVSIALESTAGEPRDLAAFFARVQPVSIDVGLLERSGRVRVVPGDFGWDDIGTWGALRRSGTEDAQGNVTRGMLHALDSSGNVVHAERGTVVLYGVEDLVVVTTEAVTLVTTVERSADLKRLVDSLPSSLQAPA